MLPTKFLFTWSSSFRGEDFYKSTNQKQELPVVSMFANGSGRNEQSSQKTFHRCFLPSFGSFGQSVSDEKIFQKSTNQKQELSMAAMFINESGRNQQNSQKTFHRCFLLRFFRNRSMRNNNCLWQPCLRTNRDEMSYLYRGHSIYVSYQVSVHLPTRFQRKRFFLEIDQSESRIACGGHVC